MYRSRKLSDIEQDAILLYQTFPHKSTQIVARELKAPLWYTQNILFKYLNGGVVNGEVVKMIIVGERKIPRQSLNPTSSRLLAEAKITQESGIKLKTYNKETM